MFKISGYENLLLVEKVENMLRNARYFIKSSLLSNKKQDTFPCMFKIVQLVSSLLDENYYWRS